MAIHNVLEYFADSSSSSWHHVLSLSVLTLLAVAVRLFLIKTRPGLSQIPGPFLASILPIDRVLTAASGHQFLKHIAYHKKYGALVRVGPNHVSIANPECIPQIYGITTRFRKSNFYVLFDAVTATGKVPTVFSVRNDNQHKKLKRQVAHAYSMSSLVELEPMTDPCTRILQAKLDTMQDRPPVDFGLWLHWYAFDVITSITFSNRLGFMEMETDVSGIIESIEGRLIYNAIIGQIPSAHAFLLGNRVVSTLASRIPAVAKLNSARYIVQFAERQLERYKSADKSVSELRDMLARFNRSSADGVPMTDKELLSHASSNIFAGSDTTAISLRAIFYYLCKNSSCYAKVVQEIDDMDARGELSELVTFAEASRMKYFQVCMKEAMRLHPSCGQLLERVVPEGGDTVCGVWLPAGTVVGINPWVTGRDKKTYGADADVFRPERWLDADPARLKLMERNFLAFGSGSRSCLGKNISLLEMSKLVPQLLRNYKIELADPEAEWRLAGYWFVEQYGLSCRITRRRK